MSGCGPCPGPALQEAKPDDCCTRSKAVCPVPSADGLIFRIMPGVWSWYAARLSGLYGTGIWSMIMDHYNLLAKRTMRISVTQAKGRLTELVRRAEAGDDVVLTRHGQAAVKLTPVRRQPDAGARQAVIARVQASAANKRIAGPRAARSQDYLYDDHGLPE